MKEKLAQVLHQTTLQVNARRVFEDRLNDIKKNPDFTDDERRVYAARLTNEHNEARRQASAEILASIDNIENQEIQRLSLKAGSQGHQLVLSNALRMIEMLGASATAVHIQGVADYLREQQDVQALYALKSICFKRCPDAARTVDFGENIMDNIRIIHNFKLNISTALSAVNALAAGVGLNYARDIIESDKDRNLRMNIDASLVTEALKA